MLVVVSPAKKLDMTPIDVAGLTEPMFQEETRELAGVAARLSATSLKKLMGISDALAELNKDRFANFGSQTRKAAAFAFAGDTYQGLEADSLDPDELSWAQDHLRILSGLYGLLRPLDEIEPYRLEMCSRLTTKRGKSLYDFWGTTLAEVINSEAQKTKSRVLINCASQEYFFAVDQSALNVPVITPTFLENSEKGAKIISFYAKKARGAMARFIVTRRLSEPDQIKEFDLGGYRYQAEQSSETNPVFLRG